MINNKNTKKIIENFLVKSINAVFPTVSGPNELFFFRIPITLNRRKINDLQRINKIQVICQDAKTFNSTFKNNFFSSTTNYMSYNESDNNVMLDGLLQKSIFLKYGKKNKRSSNLVFEDFFSSEKFEDSDFGKYNINLSTKFSKSLDNKNIKNIRILLLDEKNNIIDETSVLECDFKKVKSSNKLISDKEFYQTYFLNKFSNEIKISTNKSCNLINVTSSSLIDKQNYNDFDVKLSYLNNDKSITCVAKGLSFEENKFTLSEKVENLCFKIAEDYYLGKTVFNFKVIIDLHTKSKKLENIFSKNQKSLTSSKEISLSRENRFILTCSKFFRNKIFSQTMKRIQLKQEVKTIGNASVLNSVTFNGNVEDKVLQNISIKSIKLNKNDIDNNIYKNKDFIVENIIKFKGKNILEVFTSNTFDFFCKSKSREIIFEIELEFLGKKHIFASKKCINKSDYETSVRKTNKITKTNMSISSIEINTEISQETRSIFDIKGVSITNLKAYNDIAYSLGYILNSQGDIENFLANCIVKVENTTSISDIDFSVNKTNYFFFKELFNMQEFQTGTISINKSYIESYIKTDDYFSFIHINKSNLNKNIINFFLSSDSINSFRGLSKEKSLNIENSFKLKILPIPKIISEYRGYGLDSLGNPINDNLYEDINDISSIKRRLSRELVVYLYTSNQNLNWQKFNKYKEILMSREKSELVSNYSEFFNDIIFLTMNDNDFYSENFRYDKNEILNLQNIDETYLNSSLQVSSIEEDFSSKYFNFSLSNKELRLVNNDLYKINFLDSNYSSTDNSYKVKSIEVVKSESQSQTKIDISNLLNIYEINNIKDTKYYIKSSTHFLMTNKEKDLNRINIDGTDFSRSFYGGKDCLTYNLDYVNKKPFAFSNLKNHIDQTKISCITENDKVYLVISDYANNLNILNLNYSMFSEFFDFCKKNNINDLVNIVQRFSISAQISENDDFIFAVINHNIPYINLNDQNLSLESLSKINTLIVT